MNQSVKWNVTRVLKVAQLEFSRLAPISTGVKNYALSLLPAED